MIHARMSEADRLELCGLEVACVIGDRPEERGREQRLIVDVSLALDLSAAGRSDALADTVDYAELAEGIRAELRRARCHMIETAAACVAGVCLADPRIRSVRVRVEKPGGVGGLRAAAVVIERERETPDSELGTSKNEGGRTLNAQRSTRNAQVPVSDLRPPASEHGRDARATEGAA
jgi:dihydroneopterin aldolase